ncbi:LacI family DNA-binding transcriptional regulator [Pleomorphomonas carboxyditropha]|uniref:LacI family transcriptional regulator n=1 Tax=Pleomorphomonas carboxyditropha TaxID=2023338 RepID=A0A2G9WPD1_9HYPH|nr:LacI family DNA-binding transcriptional regulator [Pleomorphomonas carboxyditropha]PIO96533.1 LacI family transcriptional regulator [Pleomorphomonas carboxyditropha]
MKRPTQKDVAKLAGVSQAAVSMVLSGAGVPTVSSDTWARITEAARTLGYAPNRFAQALKTRRTMTIACIVPDITNPFYPVLIRGVQAVAQEGAYDVITVNTDGDPARERHFLDWAHQGRVDGVIGVFFTLRAADFRSLVEAGVPVVRIESARKKGGDIAIDDIFVDSREAARAVVDYLIGRGHRRIAMLAGTGGPQRVRVDGYREAMAAAGMEPSVTITDAFSEEAGFAAAQSILENGYRPTAIFAANDLMAIGVMRALRDRQLRIPDDVAVVGFDDISPASLVSPPLTTVSQFQARMGERAAEALLERLRGLRPPHGTTEEVRFQLVERASA